MNQSSSPFFDLISLGAAETVTGSKHILKWENKTFLIDCGMFQGEDTQGFKEWDYEKFDQKFIQSLDAVFLTHAHLDHCGYLPKLVRDGFKGPIFATKATAELAEIVMRDAAKIASDRARRANKKITKESKKEVALYQSIHVEQTLALFNIVSFSKKIHLEPFDVTFHYAGHIPGASTVSFYHTYLKERVTFSGDLGRSHDPLLYGPEAVKNSHYIVVESTYGDRVHPDHNEEKAIEELTQHIRSVKKKNAPLLIAAFSVQRTQLLYYYLDQVFKKHPELELPIFADSPMAMAVGNVFKHSDEYLKIDAVKIAEIYENIQEIGQQWDRENMDKMPVARVIISSSGMMSGGFVAEHFKAMADNPDAILYLPGYMGKGTLGRELADGLKEIKVSEKSIGPSHETQVSEKIISVKCQVHHSHLFSAHADQQEIINWIYQSSPQNLNHGICLVHGEVNSQEILKEKLEEIGYTNIHIQLRDSVHRVIIP